MQTKEEVRSSLRQRSKQFAPSSFILEDRASVDALLRSPSYENCATLFAFSPLPSEVDISLVLEDALSHKRLALPRCQGDSLKFLFVSAGWNERVRLSKLGVREPLGGDIAIPDSQSLILVPAMAYTTTGERLGRGKGYYDRYLEEFPTIPTVGICRSYQLLDSLPTENWDVQVGEVLCNGVIYQT